MFLVRGAESPPRLFTTAGDWRCTMNGQATASDRLRRRQIPTIISAFRKLSPAF